MNKVFKKVFNAARGMMMVVNESTSSVQTGKNKAVAVALGATLTLASFGASALTLEGQQTMFQAKDKFVYHLEDLSDNTLKIVSTGRGIWHGTSTPSRIVWNDEDNVRQGALIIEASGQGISMGGATSDFKIQANTVDISGSTSVYFDGKLGIDANTVNLVGTKTGISDDAKDYADLTVTADKLSISGSNYGIVAQSGQVNITAGTVTVDGGANYAIYTKNTGRVSFTAETELKGKVLNNGSLSLNGKTTTDSQFTSNGTLKLGKDAQLILSANSTISGALQTEIGSVVTLEDGVNLSLNDTNTLTNLTIQGNGHVDIITSGTSLYKGTNTINVNGNISIVSEGKAVSGYGSQLISAKNVYIEAGDGIYIPDDVSGRGGKYVKIVDFDNLHIKGADYGIVNNAYTTNQPHEMVIKGKAGSTLVIENNHETKAAIQNYSAKVAVNENHNAETIIEAGTISVKSPGYAVISRAGLVSLKANQVNLQGKVYADNGDVTVDASEVGITNDSVGVNARNGAQVKLGSDETDTVSITVTPEADTYAMGIQVRNPDTEVTAKGNALNVKVGASENGVSAGVLVQGNADGKTGTKMGTINLNSANTKIEAADSAMVAYAKGELNVTGNLTATAQNAIELRGESTVNVNTAGGKTVVLNGDVNFNKGNASGTNAWGDVNLVLDTADSVWNGTVKATWDVPATAEDFRNSKLNLTLKNGAQWNPTAVATTGKLQDAAAPAMFRMVRAADTSGQMGIDISKLTLDDGVINLPDGVEVGVNELDGNGTLNIGVGADGTTGAGLNVGQATEGSALDVTLMNGDLTQELTSDDITADQAAAILGAVDGVETTATVKEGFENGEISVGADGTTKVTANTLMTNALDLATAAPLAINRLLMNDVRKRLGDLRSAEGTHGVWARYDGGRLSGAMGLENDFHTLQAGIDTVPTADAARFGVALSYTKSDADMKRGGAEMDAFGLAVYGTKFYDNGLFVDVIGRLAKADTDLTIDGQVKGSMDNLAVSLSGEAGWRFNMTERHYVEPQVEVTYTRVDNGSLQLDNGKTYEFDAVDSVIGRAGFAAGFTCPNKMGDVYVRASVVREFMGDAGIAVRNGKPIEVNGSDTWFEYGIGANFNVNKNTYVYADIERTSGAALDEDWRANVGVRYSF